MNTYNTTERTTARLVPNDRLNAITSLIGEGAVFEGSFHSKDDLGIKVDGQLIGGIVFDDALIDIHPRARLRGKIDYRGDLDSTL